MKKQIKNGIKKKKDSLVKKMPHPAVEFDRDKNEVYLPQDESAEPSDHTIDEVVSLSDEDLHERPTNDDLTSKVAGIERPAAEHNIEWTQTNSPPAE